MPQAERQRRWYANLTDEQRAARRASQRTLAYRNKRALRAGLRLHEHLLATSPGYRRMRDPTIRKLERLMERGATEGERAAARRALEKREQRLGYAATAKVQSRRARFVRRGHLALNEQRPA